MEIITSHTNADFDALASMVAAKKLYPEATLVFPGSQEKSMRDFFLESAFYVVDIERLKHVDLNAITRLIIVDNRNPDRLGKLASILDRPNLSIHIYDHHPAMEGDLRGELEVVEKVGATITILIELLRKKNISITPMEATILALGIYEETGSLLYVSTTERDAQAVAYLLSQGAMLSVVSDFITRELTPEQTAVLNNLMTAAMSYEINGVRVVIAAMDTAHFVPDLANLAQRMKEKENLDVLFLVVQMGEKTQIIARSRTAWVNAGNVLEQFGGGGHATAASAVTKDMTYLQARERLIDILKKHIKPDRSAKEIMTSPVMTIPSGSTIAEAGEAMTRFSVNVLPILNKNKYEGIITREVVQKALFHGLGKQAVNEFMTSGGPVAFPEMPMAQVERIMIEERQRFIPVLDHNNTLAGAITRTDLLRSLHEQRLDVQPENDGPRSIRNVKRLIETHLPQDVLALLTTIGTIADEAGFPVYLVGGIVRDLMMRITNLDIDIVIQGDGITFAEMLQQKTGGRITMHQKFGTAVVVLLNGLKLDIATARHEYYNAPAALPTVELSSIKRDLYRRDFTINTLAVRLNKSHFGELIDFFGAQRDIKEKTIRVLHNLSFVEDPTRVLRAIRFEQRFDFHLNKHTENLIKTAVSMRLFNRLRGERFFQEVLLSFAEAEPLKILVRMKDFDLLKFIHPALKTPVHAERIFNGIQETLTWFRLLYLGLHPEKWFVYFLGLLDRLKEQAVDEAFDRIAAPLHIRKRVHKSRSHYSKVLPIFVKQQNLPPSRVYDLLQPLDIETILLMMSKAVPEQVKKNISLYLTHLRTVVVELDGEDLKTIGISPGPKYKKIFAELLDAKLDGFVKNKEDEIAFVKSRFL
ncbi:MAG: CBS domain-containing protein [Nitrospirota bacterium]